MLLPLVLLTSLLCSSTSAAAFRPVLIVHGQLSEDEGSQLACWIRDAYPGIYIQNYSINHWMSLLVDMNTQVDNLAKLIQADPNLKGGFDVVAHSQGALVSRGYIERYNNPPVFNYISLGGPQGGVFGVPDLNDWCLDTCAWLADVFALLQSQRYTNKIVQDISTFAQYWKDPLHMSLFLNSSAFIADVNNERPVKNQTYKDHITSLNHMVLVMAEMDRIVVPKESAHFGFFAPGSDTRIQNLTATTMYTEDWIGLKTLDESKRLTLRSVNCSHEELITSSCRHYVLQLVLEWTGVKI